MRILLFICFAALFSCSSGNTVPKEIIQPQAMKFIVWDMMQAGEFSISQFAKDSNNIKRKTTETFRQVFAIHKITKDQFYTSFQYYQSHPQQNKILFDSLSAYAGRMRENSYKKRQ